MTNDILVILDILLLKNLISAKIKNFNDKLLRHVKSPMC